MVPHHDRIDPAGDPRRRPDTGGRAGHLQRAESPQRGLGPVPGRRPASPRAHRADPRAGRDLAIDLPVRPRDAPLDHPSDRIGLPAPAGAALPPLIA